MTNRFKKMACCATMLLLLVAGTLQADEADNLRAENAALMAQVEQLKAQVADLTRTVQQLTGIQKDLVDRLRSERKKEQAAELERSNLQAKLAAAKADGDELVARRIKLYTNFNADMNRTLVATEYYLLDLGGALRSKQAFRLTYDYAGKEPPALPGNVGLEITAQNTGGAYAHVKTGILDVDGKTYTCQKASYESKRNRGIGKRSNATYDEQLTLAVSPQTLQAVAAGSKVRLKIGRVDVELKGDPLASFTAMQRRISSK